MHGTKYQLVPVSRTLIVVGCSHLRRLLLILSRLLLLLLFAFKQSLEPFFMSLRKMITPLSSIGKFGAPMFFVSALFDASVRLTIFGFVGIHLMWLIVPSTRLNTLSRRSWSWSWCRLSNLLRHCSHWLPWCRCSNSESCLRFLCLQPY